MKPLRPALFFIACCCLPTAAPAADLPPIVTPEWLQGQLGSPGLVVVDIRDEKAYDGGHIPGAVSLPYSRWMVKRDGLSDELPEPETLASVLGAAGIAPESRVVTVGKADNIGPEVGRMTRFVFTLAYAGVNTAAVLDGGMNRWEAEKRPLSKTPVAPQAVRFTPHWNKGLMADRETVARATDAGLVLCDVRPAGFFEGDKVKKPEVAKAGHLPGAHSLRAEDLFVKEGSTLGLGGYYAFVPAAELESAVRAALGPNYGRQTVTYCNTGVLSSLGWFVLNRVLGHDAVRMYDGSLEEWTQNPDAPVVR